MSEGLKNPATIGAIAGEILNKASTAEGVFSNASSWMPSFSRFSNKASRIVETPATVAAAAGVTLGNNSIGKPAVAAAAAGATLGASAVGTAAGVFSAMGFTSIGPAAGSVAASWMSSIALSNGVGVATGSTYAAIQSFMMSGMIVGTCGTAAVVGGVAGLAVYGAKKYYSNTHSNEETIDEGANQDDAASAVLKMREAIKQLEQREEDWKKEIDSLLKEAKDKLAKGDKQNALSAYRLKKQYEEEILNIQDQRMTLETQRLHLESASHTSIVVDALNTGKNAIRKLQSEMGTDKIENIMDEIQEQAEVSNEINQTLTQSVDPLLASDEDLLVELESIVAEDLKKDLIKAVPSPNEQVELNMPSLPESKLLDVVHDDSVHRKEEVCQQFVAETSRL